MSEQRKPGLLEALLTLASTAVMTWVILPPQERMWIKLGTTSKLHQWAGKLAWRAGHRGMGDELAQRDFQRYEIAYWLSVARDKLAGSLEDMRP